MKLSKKSEYGLRALIELTGHPTAEWVQRQHIAKNQRIPLEFLEQILLRLRSAGIVRSRRGAGGGYALAKPSHRVSIGQVIRILDGPIAPISCVSKMAYQKCQDCPYADTAFCPIQSAMGKVRNAIADILDNYTIQDFARGSQVESQRGS